MENGKVISLSKRQIRRLSNGHTVALSRNGSKIILTQKAKKNTVAQKIMIKIEKLKQKLELVKKYDSPQGLLSCCNKEFKSKQAHGVHYTRMHKKNWSTSKKKKEVA